MITEIQLGLTIGLTGAICIYLLMIRQILLWRLELNKTKIQ